MAGFINAPGGFLHYPDRAHERTYAMIASTSRALSETSMVRNGVDVRAGVFHGVKNVVVEDAPDPTAEAHDIIVAVKACGICGSDLHTYTHGSFVQPGQIMGHEFAGEVVEVGAAVQGIDVADRVTAVPLVACGRCPRCLEGNNHLCEVGLAQSIAYGLPGGFSEYVRVPNAILGGNVHKLPSELSFREGALVEPMSVAVHAAKIAYPGPSDVAVVLGLGSIGQNAVQALKALGAARVIGIDVSKLRLKTANELGADTVIDANEVDPLEAVQEITGIGAYGIGARADIVLECSGVPKMLDAAVRMTRHGGKLLVAALYDEPVPIDATMVVQKELKFGGTFAYCGEFPETIDLLRSGRVQAEPLISHDIPLEEIDRAFEVQLSRDESVKVLVEP